MRTLATKVNRFWLSLTDSAMTWPSLRVQLHLLPWSWRLLPRGWYDYSPRGGDRAGWWSVTGQWLGLEVDFGLNLPPFEWVDGSKEDGDDA